MKINEDQKIAMKITEHHWIDGIVLVGSKYAKIAKKVPGSKIWLR